MQESINMRMRKVGTKIFEKKILAPFKRFSIRYSESARFQLSEKYNHAYILKISIFGVRDAECLVSLRSNLPH